MRHSSFAFALVLLACGERATPPAAPVPAIDRTPAARPDGVIVEIALDGGDEVLGTLLARLPPVPERAGLPSRVRTLLDGLIDAPPEIVSHVSSDSPLRIVMARIDGQTRSAIALRLDAPMPSERGDGPRGSTRVGERAAVDGDRAVISDDAAMLDRAFGYLAYSALDAQHDAGIEIDVPAATLASEVRTAIERQIEETRARALASITAARAAHDRPPDLGDPEALVALVADALRARAAYLPDLGDARITLRPAPSGLAIVLTTSIASASPLDAALAHATRVSSDLVAALPTSSAIALASGLDAPTPADGVEALASIAGERLGAAERASLDEAAHALASIAGTAHAIAIGADDARGAFVVALSPGASDAPLPTPWGRALPWTTSLIAAVAGCTPLPPRAVAADRPVCGDVTIATRPGDAARADAIGADASMLAQTASDRLAQHAAPTSPDLARDLGALDPSSFALLALRPLRALPLFARLSGEGPAHLPRGDGAIVLAASRDGDRLRIELRASTAALADLATLVDLFSERR